MKQIGILGGGVWGCALAKLLSKNQVKIFVRDEKALNLINNQKIISLVSVNRLLDGLI